MWFAVWTVAGNAVGHWLGIPGTGMVAGCIVGLVTVFTWPWILPAFIDDWMHRS
jgi:hypothetical protein